MLYLVLLLVIAAFGLLITSIVVKVTMFAWVSLGVSVLAAIGLVVDWALRRRAARHAASTVSTGAADGAADAEPGVAQGAEGTVAGEHPARPAPSDETTELPAVVASVAWPDEEPAEEQTDAADVLVVCELTDEVVVIDEHPRYHLSRCPWLGRRASAVTSAAADAPDTLPLPIDRARQLGFTPCARCTPDAVLAARYRSRSSSGHTGRG